MTNKDWKCQGVGWVWHTPSLPARVVPAAVIVASFRYGLWATSSDTESEEVLRLPVRNGSTRLQEQHNHLLQGLKVSCLTCCWATSAALHEQTHFSRWPHSELCSRRLPGCLIWEQWVSLCEVVGSSVFRKQSEGELKRCCPAETSLCRAAGRVDVPGVGCLRAHSTSSSIFWPALRFSSLWLPCYPPLRGALGIEQLLFHVHNI